MHLTGLSLLTMRYYELLTTHSPSLFTFSPRSPSLVTVTFFFTSYLLTRCFSSLRVTPHFSPRLYVLIFVNRIGITQEALRTIEE
ncbi:hypothetical protein ACSQ67_018995 [Phaseolus vulgaris]